ncbi:MAG: rhodanese-like domain-containing protein [Gammaproteobacteria bacterium]|jgi:rhodanese-related sulfurtransferase
MEKLSLYVAAHPWLVALTVVAALLVVAYEVRARRDAFAAISPQDLIRLQNRGALVLDLRKSEDYAAGHIGGARDFDASQLVKANETLRKHREKPVVVYCDTGSTGAAAARVLAGQGFTQAFNLRGGIAAWRADNLPLEQGAEPARGPSTGKGKA